MMRTMVVFGCLMLWLPLSEMHGQKSSFHTAVAPPPEAGTIFIYPERIPLQREGMVTVERAMMFVPLNRSRPDSDVIMIDVYRFPRTSSADPDAPPIFFLHGGPGFEGLERALSRRGHYESRWQDLTEFSDVVVIGQRGIGSSKPDTKIDQSTDPVAADQPSDREAFNEHFREVLGQERRVWEELGVDLKGLTVVEAAADVRDIAKALGYDKIVLWGGSFGSHWSMTIMRNHPEIVERAVLTGMEGPDHTYDHPGWLWNVYKRVAAEAEASEQLKDQIPAGGLIQAAKDLVEKAEKDPFTVIVSSSDQENPVWVDGNVMKHWVRGYSGGLKSWPANIISMVHGDFDRPARRTYAMSKNRVRNFGTASYWMLDTGSGITAKRLAEFESDPAQQVIGSTYGFYTAGCPAWDSDLGDEFRQNFETEIPAVIIHGTWDQSTPYENALELVPFFKNSTFVTVKRGSHGALGEAFNAFPEFEEAVLRFAATGDTSELPQELELPEPDWTVPEIDD